MDATRRSPVADWYERHSLRALPADAPVTLRDVSWQRRFGCKGPAAPPWLASQSLVVPQPANTWTLDPRGILVARIATGEFLVEAFGSAQERVEQVRGLLSTSPAYPVVRQDAAFVLAGPHASEVLLQTCSFNFSPCAAEPLRSSGPVILTSMVGVSVTVIPMRTAGGVEHPVEYRVWCDPSFGLYLWSTLTGIAEETGGGAVANSGG